MAPAVVTVWFDYACPHSYHGLKQLEELASSIGFEIDRRPFLVRAVSLEVGEYPSGPEGVEDGSRRRPLYKPGHGIGTEPASNRSVSTLAVHAATAYAKERGLDRQFYWAASKEYWESGTDLGNLYTIRRLAVATGLDWREMWAELESGRYNKLVLARHEEALKAGVTRTPSIQIGRRMHSGPIGAEELGAAIEAANIRP
jgi:predicted DsbA family dithiol-disulfide isomerase